jgi:AcrR family transcriptional regulator
LARLGENEPFSLRAVAREADIVPPSVYLHFADKTALTLAVLGKLFTQPAASRDEAEQVVAEAGGSAWDRLLARSLAYVRFGLERPGHYKVFYEGWAIPKLDTPRVAALGQPMLDRTAELILGVLQERQAKQVGDAQRLALLLWAGLHGVVSLQINKPTMSWPEAGELTEPMTRAVVGMP